jgi:hypothetical protein
MIALQAIAGIASVLGLGAGLLWLVWKIESGIKAKEQRDRLEEDLNGQKKESQRWANASVISTADRLREHAAQKRKGGS